MRSSLVVAASLALVALASGCTSSADDASPSAGSSDLTAAKITPKEGLFTGVAVMNDDTCGFQPGLGRIYIADAETSQYATSYVYPNVDITARFAISLSGKSGSGQETNSFDVAVPSGSPAKVTVDTTFIDTWQSTTTFVRRASESIRCEGDGCSDPSVATAIGAARSFPCSATMITAFAQASCDAYPFRQVYDDSVTSVWVTGTFNDWAKTPAEGALEMKKGEDGAWSLDAQLPVPSAGDGKHLYKFIKNGASYWDQDMSNPIFVADGQTGTNSILYCQ